MIDRDEFRQILADNLVPFFRGTTIGSAQTCRATAELTAYDGPCEILVAPQQSPSFRIPLQRSQPFSEAERRLVDVFARRLASVLEMHGDDFFDDLLAAVPRRVVAEFVALPRSRSAVFRAVQQMESLASQTYEGQQISAAVGITGSVGHGTIRDSQLWDEDFASVLSNGFDTMLVAGSDGRFYNLLCLEQYDGYPFAPTRLCAIAGWTDENPNRVALALNRNGDVLVFRSGNLQFAKRRGSWVYYPHDSIVKRLGGGPRTDLRTALYASCLDASFARTGACLCLVTSRNRNRVTEYVKKRDLLDEERQPKAQFLSQALRRDFHRLDRRLRQEILAIDGATVVAHDGEILAVGAIVKVGGGSSGGGRRAAAVSLSNLGIAVKVSADGPITGFQSGHEIFAV